jgi:hypothetical protein
MFQQRYLNHREKHATLRFEVAAMNLNPRRKVNFQKKFQLRTMKEEWKGPDVDHVFSNSRDKCLELTRF